jgi:menaquinone-dependent protoporphyrinogen oxidase
MKTLNVLVVYATTEGHGRELASFAERTLDEAGHNTRLIDAASSAADLEPNPYDAAILVASLHVGHYQPSLVEFARRHHATLNHCRTAFISVSLSAAGANPEDWKGLKRCLDRFLQETDWQPTAIHQAAGAIRYSKYNFFKRLVIRFIAARRGQKTITSRDYDLTDYGALKRFVLQFVAAA